MQAHLYLVLCVCAVVFGVLDEEGVADVAVQADLEEVRAAEAVDILRAALNMPQKYLHRVKSIAEFALARHTVLEALLELFVLLDLPLHLHHPTLLLPHSLTQHPIGLLHLLQLLFQLLDFFFVLLGRLQGF